MGPAVGLGWMEWAGGRAGGCSCSLSRSRGRWLATSKVVSSCGCDIPQSHLWSSAPAALGGGRSMAPKMAKKAASVAGSGKRATTKRPMADAQSVASSTPSTASATKRAKTSSIDGQLRCLRCQETPQAFVCAPPCVVRASPLCTPFRQSRHAHYAPNYLRIRHRVSMGGPGPIVEA